MTRPVKVDINRATKEELTQLPGIGPKLAQKIIDHRQSVGRFTTVDDLAQVSGITEHTLEGLRELVTTGGLASLQGKRLTPGGLFESYRIEEHLAEGATSDVYRVIEVESGRTLALKTFRGALANDGDLVKDLRWTSRTVADLDDPAIVVAEEVDITADGQVYVTLPYVEGDSLADWLLDLREGRKRLSTVEALSITRQAVLALAAAHRSSLVHYNLTPRKMLVSKDTRRLCLLGLESPETWRMLGAESSRADMRYLSPEQLQGKLVDGRSNIYSLGVILYELLSASEWPGYAEADEDHDVTDALWGRLPETTRHTVRTCLRIEPWARFQSAKELLLSVDRALLAEPELDRPAAIATEERSAILEEVAALERVTMKEPDERRSSARKWWPYVAAPLILLAFSLILVRPGRSLSDVPSDAESELLEHAVGQETLEALPMPQPVELTPTRSLLSNMLTARALAAPAVPGLAATPTFIPTHTPTPTNTPTATPTDTPTSTPTAMATPTATATATLVRRLPTRTPTPEPTEIPLPATATTLPPPPPPPPPPPSPQPTATDVPPPTETPPPPTPTPPLGSG